MQGSETLHKRFPRKNMHRSTSKNNHENGELLDTDKDTMGRPRKACRQDVLVLFGGLTFICGLIGAMYGLGIWRGWYAPSGYYHNDSSTSPVRFQEEPEDPEAAGRWYYWKLKKEEVTVWTRLFVWVCYSSHQLFIWIITYLAQASKNTSSPNEKYSTNLGKYAWMSLAANVFFHILHLVQTHITYDATAQDVSIASSQSSVIMLLIFVLLLEYNERGLIFGWPTAKHKDKISSKLRLSWTPVYITRKYHAYAFAWASIYTFWYHPMENTYGHALGFFHTWIIMLQGSLMYTDIHKNKYWRFVLEAWVALHGSLVAVQTSGPGLANAIWPMFMFGFMMILVLSWIFILPFWEKIPFWVRFAPFVAYLAVTIGSYSAIPDKNGKYWVRMNEIIRMPAFFYPYFLLCWGVLYFLIWIQEKLCSLRSRKITSLRRTVCLSLTLLIYIVLVIISSLVELYGLRLQLLMITVFLVTLYCVAVAVTFMLLQEAFLGIRGVSPNTSKSNIPEMYTESSELDYNNKS